MLTTKQEVLLDTIYMKECAHPLWLGIRLDKGLQEDVKPLVEAGLVVGNKVNLIWRFSMYLYRTTGKGRIIQQQISEKQDQALRKKLKVV